MALRLCVLLWAREGRESDLYQYEDTVLGLLDGHDGRLIARERVHQQNPGDPAEVQIIEFDSQAAMGAYMLDPRRAALHDERDAAIARTQLLHLE